jgi:ATP-dependent DNA helicase RecG
MVYVKEKGKITNKEYQEIAGVRERSATIELNDLANKNILHKFGTTGRGTYYAAVKAQERRRKTNDPKSHN